MAGFQIKTFEQLVTSMITWVKGNTTKLKDFSIGSKNRTILEAVAYAMEQLYYRIWQGLKYAIEEGIYVAFDFTLLPAKAATGEVIFSRSAAAGQDYIIPLGTVVATEQTDIKDSVQFETTETVTLLAGTTQITAPIKARIEGTEGNVAANTITKFVSKPVGIEAVTNPQALTDGREIETRDERKQRFREYVIALHKASKPALVYGAESVDGVDTAVAVDNPYLYALFFNNTGGTYTDHSEALNDPYSIDITLNFDEAEDALYLGVTDKFDFLYIHMSQLGVGSAGVWEYFDGNTWQTLTVTDATSGFTANGSVTFNMPTDWKDSKINNIWAFWIRFRITTASYTTMPIVDYIFASPPPGYVDVFIQNSNGDASAELIDSVASVLDKDYRGAGVTINVRAPNKITLPVSCEIRVNSILYDKEEIRSEVRNVIIDYLETFRLGDDLYLSKLINEIMAVKSGLAVTSVEITNPTDDILVSAGEVIVPDEINTTVTVVN